MAPRSQGGLGDSLSERCPFSPSSSLPACNTPGQPGPSSATNASSQLGHGAGEQSPSWRCGRQAVSRGSGGRGSGTQALGPCCHVSLHGKGREQQGTGAGWSPWVMLVYPDGPRIGQPASNTWFSNVSMQGLTWRPWHAHRAGPCPQCPFRQSRLGLEGCLEQVPRRRCCSWVRTS